LRSAASERSSRRLLLLGVATDCTRSAPQMLHAGFGTGNGFRLLCSRSPVTM
jgi:hypothetical protein